MREPYPTTRFLRHCWRRRRYHFNYLRWLSWKWEYAKVAGKTKKVGLKAGSEKPPLQSSPAVSSAAYNGFDGRIAVPEVTHVVTFEGYARPPHVKITQPWYVTMTGLGIHAETQLVGLHNRRVHTWRRHRRQKRTARERKITGANWFYFREGYFPDWDILERHPNETDRLNGLPPGDTLWPVPLGY